MSTSLIVPVIIGQRKAGSFHMLVMDKLIMQNNKLITNYFEEWLKCKWKTKVHTTNYVIYLYYSVLVINIIK